MRDIIALAVACFGALIHAPTLHAQDCIGALPVCSNGVCRGNVLIIFQSPASGRSCRNSVDVYPDGITRIEGNLQIGSSRLGLAVEDVSDLSKFSSVTEITGNLIVSRLGQANSPTSLSALRSLRTVGGNFIVGSSATRDFVGNDRFESVGDFPDLTSIGGDFSVRENPNLSTLGRFPRLRSIGGGLLVFLNQSITSLGDFSALVSIGEEVTIDSNPTLPDLGRFPALRAIGGMFQVRSNNNLTSLGAFPALSSIGGNFAVGVADNPRLGGGGNRRLSSLGDFSALRAIGGTFDVQSTDQLTSLGDFSAVRTISGDFTVAGNSRLTSLDDLSGLESIGGGINIHDNLELSDCCSLPKPVVLQVNRRLIRVEDNDEDRGTCRGPAATFVGAICSPLIAIPNYIQICSASRCRPSIIQVISRGRWTATTAASWITFRSGSFSGGTRNLSLEVEDNLGPTERSAPITLSPEGADDIIVTLHQRGATDQSPTFGSSISPTVPEQFYNTDQTVAVMLPAAAGGNAPLRYTLSPALPPGLFFDAVRREIVGTPFEEATRTEYTYTAVDEDASAEFDPNVSSDLTERRRVAVDDTVAVRFHITVAVPLSFGAQTLSDQFYLQGSEHTVTLPAATSGNAPLRYTLSPELPTGLTFDAARRQITGIPVAVMARTEYTYTVTDTSNTVATLPSFGIQVLNLDINADGEEDQRDAQVLYYTYLTALNPATLQVLLGRLAADAAASEQRARDWQRLTLSTDPSPDLTQDDRVDQRDARVLYYAYRFGETLQASPALLQALLGGLASNPTAALVRARALIL